MSIDIKIENNVLVLVQLETHKSLEFPIIWLRDNCQCHECFDRVTSCRKIDWETFNVKQGALRDAEVRLFDGFCWIRLQFDFSLMLQPICWASHGMTSIHRHLTLVGYQSEASINVTVRSTQIYLINHQRNSGRKTISLKCLPSLTSTTSSSLMMFSWFGWSIWQRMASPWLKIRQTPRMKFARLQNVLLLSSGPIMAMSLQWQRKRKQQHSPTLHPSYSFM